MFLNCSNHASKNWNIRQREVAEKWGEIIDYPFPVVPANADETEVKKIAEDVMKDILEMKPSVIMCQGEFTLTYLLVTGFLYHGIKVVAACSERKTEECILQDGSVEKKTIFEFIKFRDYIV